MSNWTAGNLSGIGYTFGYYGELNPLRARLAFLNAGLAPPPSGTHCELGYGQGVSLNIHAAASAGTWYGTDFNPAHAAFAQTLATASGTPVHLYDQSFAEFCCRDDLPMFDSICLHGIWSWVADEDRAVIVDFVRRKLKPGGALFISYNTQPGWAGIAPLRELMVDHVTVMAAPGQGMLQRVDGAFAFTETLLAADPRYARTNPQALKRFARIKEMRRTYLAHEYFADNWQPMTFSRVAKWLAPGKLSYVGPAEYLDGFADLNLTSEQQAMLAKLPDPVFHETVRDFCVDQIFRRDFWVKGSLRLDDLARLQALRDQRVVLVQPRGDIALTVTTGLGEIALQEAIYDPILDILANNQPQTLGQIEHLLVGKGVAWHQLVEAISLLVGMGAVAAAQDSVTADRAKPHTDRLNIRLCELAHGGGDIHYLASPVTGGGIAVSRFGQLFLAARQQGQERPEDWASYAWSVLKARHEHVLKDGEALSSDADNLAELRSDADEFAAKQLPILKALAVV